MPDSKPERLFIGVPLTEDARRAIAQSLPKKLPGKPVPAENWHFTLRFLGSTAADVRDQIVAHLESVSCGARFTVRFSELGGFPSRKKARVLWLGIDEGAERMMHLAAIAEGAARSAGFVPETRQFRPHLTLSRIDPPQSIAALVANKRDLGVKMTVDSVILYRSRLGGGRARYEEVERYRLS